MGKHLQADVLVTGAGVLGLAVAQALADPIRKVVVIERRRSFGLEVSSRSSEVLHAGIYYRPGSLKAALCVEGAHLTEDWLLRHKIAMAKRSKVVVAATESEKEQLHRLFSRATSCGARDLELWSRARLGTEVPHLQACEAIFSPHTAVFDTHELCRSLALSAQNKGATMAYRHTLLGLSPLGGARWQAEVLDPEGQRLIVETPIFVNAAGLDSDAVAAMAGIDVDQVGYRLHPCKGDYFSIQKGALRGMERLVYPLPEPQMRGLGVHLTIDAGGQARLGPDATYLSEGQARIYEADETKLSTFLDAAQRLFPWLRRSHLGPDRAGIRPKLAGPGEEQRDFVICHEKERGLEGLVNLVGIESPGMTAALAIAKHVKALLF